MTTLNSINLINATGTPSSSTFLRGDATWAAPTGTGTVTTTGSPANGNLTKFSGATSITNGDLSGDITTSGTLVTSVAKIAGTAVSGTTGTTNVAFSNSPTFVTPTLGAALATSINGLALTSSTGTLTISNGVTITAPTTTNILVISGTAKLSVGTSTPVSPATGDLWVDTN